MGTMVNSYGHTPKMGWHEMKRELLKAFKRDYKQGNITHEQYIAFLKSQIAQIR